MATPNALAAPVIPAGITGVHRGFALLKHTANTGKAQMPTILTIVNAAFR
jgi:hypothetical protein